MREILFFLVGIAFFLFFFLTNTAATKETDVFRSVINKGKVEPQTEKPISVLDREVQERVNSALVLTHHDWSEGLKKNEAKARKEYALVVAEKYHLLPWLIDYNGKFVNDDNPVSTASDRISGCDVRIGLRIKNFPLYMFEGDSILRELLEKKEAYAIFLEALYGKPPLP